MIDLKLYIVTGMSGAGKSHALDKLEDMGYYCVDNLPAQLTGELVSALRLLDWSDKIALGLDCRAGVDSLALQRLAEELRAQGAEVRILFLDANDQVIQRRYSQTRRIHPLARDGSVQQGINAERARLEGVHGFADCVIDTSELRPSQLSARLEDIENLGFSSSSVIINSFGFKRGIPPDSDMVFDVRFAPNPFWVDGLRAMSGLDAEVRDYVLSFQQSRQFVDMCVEMISYLLPHFRDEDKQRLSVAIGCTGGRHRSVCVAEEVGKKLAALGIASRVSHRDINNDLQGDGRQYIDQGGERRR